MYVMCSAKSRGKGTPAKKTEAGKFRHPLDWKRVAGRLI